MAKYELKLKGNYEDFVKLCHDTIMKSSSSIAVENQSTTDIGQTKVLVRVYEKHGYHSNNRKSLTLTIVGVEDDIFVSAITAGGSQISFFKMGSFGENSFLNYLIPVIQQYALENREM